MTFEESLSYLLSLGHETLAIKLGLANTEKLLSALGNPHYEFPAVQIAGTNGKGSTAVMLDSICRAAGIRTGLFTSPHLRSITERITVDGRQIAESDFASFTTRVKETAEELVKQDQLATLPSFFEHVTAIALLAFREAKIELTILETGLGGRLDSTTAARADIVAITPIAMDHEEYLGDSLAKIATEKAAIIRPGVVAVIAPQPKEAFDEIVRQCEATGVEPRLIEPDLGGEQLPRDGDQFDTGAPAPGRYRFRFCNASQGGRFRMNFTTRNDRYERVSVGLRGRHQIANAAVAMALAEALREHGFVISREIIIQGVETAKHRGRLELCDGQPRILFDGAHNPAAARALRDYLDEFIKEPITMIFGAMRDKALEEMASILFPVAHKLILTEFENPRAASLEILKLAIPGSFDQAKVSHASSGGEALRIAKELTPAEGLVCVTGSLYLIGEIQSILSSDHFAPRSS